MRTEMLAKNFVAGGTIGKHRIVKADATAGQVVIASAATDKLLGVSDELDHVSGERIDVHLIGIAHVFYGGTVAVGDLLTSDANGAAVVTTTANNRVVGVAMVAGVSGDIGSCLLKQGII